MYRQRPERTAAVVLAGAGRLVDSLHASVNTRIEAYTKQGPDYRWWYTFEDFSPAFRSTPIAHYFARMFTERNHLVDVDTIIEMFRATTLQFPSDIHKILCPAIVIVGSEDVCMTSGAATELTRSIPECEFAVIPGAGHACHIEEPGLFDRYVLEFVRKHKLLPE
jgi:pimeloyl-ACP methyl ester carboxylesterase